MASACVNLPVSPPHPNTSFLNMPWLTTNIPNLGSPPNDSASGSGSDFEFHLLDHPISTILPADELFSNGKLLTSAATTTATTTSVVEDTRRKIDGGGVEQYIFSPKAPRCSSRWREILGLKNKKISTPDSNKTTSSRKASNLSAEENNKTTSSRKSINFSIDENNKTTSSSKSLKFSTEEQPIKTTSSSRSLKFNTEENTTKTTSSSKSIKRFLSRTPSSDTSLSLPLLDRTSESSSSDPLTDSTYSITTCTSRLSLSSLSSSTSSTTADPDDLHRLSLDETRPRVTLLRPKPNPTPNPVSTRPIRRTLKPTRTGPGPATGVSVDSPRMNSAGKIVFQSLNRSSSSPSSFNGGPRYKHRGMERSYSANVRITPVLNVPVCSSLRGSSKSGGFGFGQLFTSSSTQKKDKTNINGEKKRSLVG